MARLNLRMLGRALEGAATGGGAIADDRREQAALRKRMEFAQRLRKEAADQSRVEQLLDALVRAGGSAEGFEGAGPEAIGSIRARIEELVGDKETESLRDQGRGLLEGLDPTEHKALYEEFEAASTADAVRAVRTKIRAARSLEAREKEERAEKMSQFGLMDKLLGDRNEQPASVATAASAYRELFGEDNPEWIQLYASRAGTKATDLSRGQIIEQRTWGWRKIVDQFTRTGHLSRGFVESLGWSWEDPQVQSLLSSTRGPFSTEQIEGAASHVEKMGVDRFIPSDKQAILTKMGNAEDADRRLQEAAMRRHLFSGADRKQFVDQMNAGNILLQEPQHEEQLRMLILTVPTEELVYYMALSREELALDGISWEMRDAALKERAALPPPPPRERGLLGGALHEIFVEGAKDIQEKLPEIQLTTPEPGSRSYGGNF